MSDSTGIQTGTPIYEALAERIRRSIHRGDFKPGELVGSEHELARQESISRMTVRKASELLVNEGLLERRPGKGLYVRTPEGGAVASGAVQVIVGNLLWEPAMQMSRGIQNEAKGDGVHVQIYDAQGNFDLDVALIDRLPCTDIKGAVIISLHSPRFSQSICHLHVNGFPFVLVDQRMHDINVPSVTADNYGGGYEVGKLLAGSGHRRIAFIGDLIAATVRDRLAGLRDAIGDAGLPFQRSLVVDLVSGTDRFGDWSACVAEAAKRLLNQPDRPTAVFCSCDAVGRALYKSLETMGLRVPQDLSVVGYDDDPLAEWLTPRLTSVRQPFIKMGEEAMKLLRDRIADPGGVAENRVIPVELIVRESVAAPNHI
jgi:DNA-binding LacI/PurR family transcriptional regulator